MFVSGTLTIDAYTDSTDTTLPLINIPNINRSWKSTTPSQTQFASYVVAASGTITVNTNSMSPTRLYLYVDAANIQVNINGLGNLLMAKGEPAYFPVTVTSLVITNTSSSVPVNVEVGFITI